MKALTHYERLWHQHVVHEDEHGTALIYINRRLINAVTSSQAFDGMRLHACKIWRVKANLAIADHNVPTLGRSEGIADPISRLQVETLANNYSVYGMSYFDLVDNIGTGERCASTSNRNFERRQGAGGRTHLVSPAMSAVSAIAGHFIDVNSLS